MATASIPSLVEQHTQKLDSSMATFQKELKLIAEKWKSLIVDHVLGNDLKGVTYGDHIAIRSMQVGQMLNQAGFNSLAYEFGQAHTLSQPYAEAILKVIPPGTAQKLIGDTPLPESTIHELINFDMSVLQQEVGPYAANVLARQLTLSTIAGVKNSMLLQNIEDSVGSFESQTGSYLNTTLASFDRTVTNRIWEHAGVQHFLYTGPNDKATRPFCKAHVGHVYSLAELKAMKNGAGAFSDVMVYGGGRNCRHRLVPDSREDI